MKVEDLQKILSACDSQATVVIDALYNHDAQKVVLYRSESAPAVLLIADTDKSAEMYFADYSSETLYEKNEQN